jgi:hypothetical protein
MTPKENFYIKPVSIEQAANINISRHHWFDYLRISSKLDTSIRTKSILAMTAPIKGIKPP